MLEDANIRQRVKAAIVEALKLQIDPEAIADNEVLFGGGLGADSTATLEVVFAVEETFGIEVNDEDLRADLFDSVNSLCNYVKRKLDDNIETGIKLDRANSRREQFMDNSRGNFVTLDLVTHFNNDGISSDADRTDGDFTGAGNTYPEEDLPPSNSVVVREGVPFRFPDKQDGLNNNVSLEGQRIPVPKGQYDTLCFLGASGGYSLEDTIRFLFANDFTEAATFGLSSWRLCHGLKYGERVAIQCSGYHFPSQHVYTDRIDVDYGIWMQRIPIRNDGLLEYIEFPDNPDLHIFSMTLRRMRGDGERREAS